MSATHQSGADWLGLVAGGALLLAGCNGGDARAPIPDPINKTSVATPKSRLALKPTASCAEFREYFADSLLRQLLTHDLPCWGCEVSALDHRAGIGTAEGQAVAAPGGQAPRFDFSDTNVQEAGVDQADLIQSDPRGYFYIARGAELLVVDALPAEELRVLARLPLNGYARGLYLDETGQRLALMVDGAGPHYLSDGPVPSHYGSGILFLDVAEPATPAISHWFWTEGYALDSRRVDNRLHLVTSFGFVMPAPLRDDDSFQQLLNDYYSARGTSDQARSDPLAAAIEQRVRQAVAAVPLDELLPVQHSGLGEQAPQALACAAVQRPLVEQQLGLMLITSVGMDGAAPASLAVANNAWRLYGSSEHLYLIQDSGGWWFDPAQTQQSVIYRYALTDAAVVPAGFGLVDGWINNSYNLSEHEGLLRVATTESRFQPSGPWSVSNHLTVLGAGASGDLEAVGAVRDFVRDERIFSARFLGARGYVVTFLQVDPLFAFDLSDPRAPRLAGQVEIPGFSTYLHPLGEDHLLTIGRAGNANGATANMQLQIFDVSDLSKPALRHAYSPAIGPNDYVFSLAEYDPHAFTFLPVTAGASAGWLSIPAQIGSGEPDRAFSGFMAFKASAAAGFAELGRVDHKTVPQNGGGCPSGRGAGGGNADAAPPPECASFAPVSYNAPLRSVVLAESRRTVLYTLSDAFIRAHDTADFSSELGRAALAPD